MLSGLYLKLLLSVGVLALVGGAYWYVSNLQNRVEKLSTQNTLLEQSNTTLTETIKEQEQQLATIEKVSAAGDTLRIEYRTIYQKQLKDIDDDIKGNKDRPVGPLLKEFFNE